MHIQYCKPGITEGIFLPISSQFSADTVSHPVTGASGRPDEVNVALSFCCFRYKYEPSTSMTGLFSAMALRMLLTAMYMSCKMVSLYVLMLKAYKSMPVMSDYQFNRSQLTQH